MARRLSDFALAVLALVVINAIVLGALRWERASRFDGAWIGTAGPLRVTMTVRADGSQVSGAGGWTRDSTRAAGPLSVTGVVAGDRVALQMGKGPEDFMTYQAVLRARELRGILYTNGRSFPLTMRRP